MVISLLRAEQNKVFFGNNMQLQICIFFQNWSQTSESAEVLLVTPYIWNTRNTLVYKKFKKISWFEKGWFLQYANSSLSHMFVDSCSLASVLGKIW